MSAQKELKISVRLDDSQPERALDDLGKAADKTTDRVAEGTRKVDRSSREAARGVDSMRGAFGAVNSELGTLLKAQIGLGAFKGLAESLGAEFRKVADEVARTSKEWQSFRKSLSGVASLSGNANTNAFAESEINDAEKAGVTPEAYKNLRESFLSKASTYVGNGKDAKISDADAAEFQQALAAYGQSKGIDANLMGEFGGGLITQAKGKQTAATMKAQAGRVLAQLEASSTDVKQLLPQQIRVQAQGLQAEDAAAVLASAPEYAPNEEATYVLRAISAMRELQQKGKGDEYGLKKGGDSFSNLKALVGTLQRRAAAGEDVDALLSEVAPEHVSQQAFRGMLNQGGVQNLEKWRGIADQTPADVIDKMTSASRTTEQGRQNAVDSRYEVERARMGLRNDELTRRRRIAETELMANKDFERQSTWTEWSAAQIPGQDDFRQQQVNRQTIQRARAELHENFSVSDAKASLNSGSTDELMRTLIKRVEEQTEAIKKQGGHGQVPAPMGGRPNPTRTRP